MIRALLTLTAVLFGVGANPCAAGQPAALYSAVEIDRFVADRGVAFPTDYQSALVDDIAREISVEFPTIITLRQGDPTPYGHAVLRISGAVTGFKPGSRTKRFLIGFGAGATVVRVRVRFIDAAGGRVLLEREMSGVTWTGVGGGDSQGAADSLARRIAKFCKSAQLVHSD
ncbi:MAG: DUF4410 domain-containing protein [Bryobacteraceae bacterium]